MQKLFRGLALAVACAFVSLLPQAASAVTIHPNDLQWLAFASGLSGFDQLTFNFDFGATPPGSSDTYTVQFFGADQMTSLSGAFAGGGSSPTLAISSGLPTLSGPFNVLLTASSSNDPAGFTLNGGTLTPSTNGVAGTPINDALLVTPIPASLPLLLTGIGLFFVVVRRRQLVQLFGQQQFA